MIGPNDTRYCTHVGMGHSPEAGYNLEDHHTGWKPELAILGASKGRILQ
jgi:hypothetical protein